MGLIFFEFEGGELTVVPLFCLGVGFEILKVVNVKDRYVAVD